MLWDFDYELIPLSHQIIEMGKALKKNITVQGLLELFPSELLDKLSDATNVDHQVKKLFGKNIFYLLLYGFLESSKASLRSLEDVYNSQKFKFLFNIDQQNTTKFNSLSDRLNSMNPEYFKRIYEYAHTMLSEWYTDSEAEKYSIIRVDSTLVKETANKLQQGILTANKHNSRKQIKYTVAMDDLLPVDVKIFTEQESSSENLTIPEVILNHDNKSGIFVFDRGVNKRGAFDDFDNDNRAFVTRISPTKRLKVLEENELKIENFNNLIIQEDLIVNLFDRQGKPSKPYRLIKTIKDDDSNEELWFLTNCRDFKVSEIISIYRKRWDIEVFFRFIKQELNFSHFVSTKINGIKNILYITLTLAILILIYKKQNNIGYKTAVRRFRIELDELITKMMIVFAGGDPKLVFR